MLEQWGHLFLATIPALIFQITAIAVGVWLGLTLYYGRSR